MRVTWAVSLPRLFPAAQTYLPASFSWIFLIKRSPDDITVALGSVSAEIPKLFFHVIRGVGKPSARHLKVTFPPKVTVLSDGGLIILAGTEERKNDIYSYKKE